MLRSMKECRERQRDLGAIAIDATGAIAWGKTSEVILAAYHNGKEIGDTVDWTDDDLIGYQF
jgi:L-asparaginase